MHVIDLLSPSTVRVGLPGVDKRNVIDAMIELVADNPSVKDIDEVRQAVVKREAEMSTGVGRGLALPHGKTDAVSGNVAALALTENPVEFEAIDGRPVRLVFLLVGTPDSKAEHIKILSRISRLMNRDDVRERMLAARTDRELYTAVTEGEAALLEG